MRRTFNLLGALGGLFLALFVVVPSAQAYTTPLPTTCSISASAPVANQAVTINVEVGATGATPATGTVDLSITRGGDELYTQTLPYNGSPLSVSGPSLPAGSYQAALDFTPSDTRAFDGCSATAPFQVAGVGDDNDNGGLPNTGGPHMYLLVLGLGLVAGGAGLVGRARVRQHA